MNTHTPPHISNARPPRRRASFKWALVVMLCAAGSLPGTDGFAQSSTPASPPTGASATVSRTAAATVTITQRRTPSDVVRAFYKAMREKRFREAFAMTMFNPAVEPLSAAEYEDLRLEFERIAGTVLEEVIIGGEQISGQTATVFGKFTQEEINEAPKPVMLMRAGDTWIIGDVENQAAIKKQGAEYFFKARIETHHAEVKAVLQRIAIAQLLYAQKNGGRFGDLPALVREGLAPADVQTPETTGYKFHVTASADGKTYAAGAVPVRHNRTGRLSFFMDANGMRFEDNGGKPLKKK